MKKFLSTLQEVFFKKNGAKESVAGDAAKFTLAFALSAVVIYFALFLTGNLLHEIAARSSEAVGEWLFAGKISVKEGGAFPHLVGVANGVPFEAQVNDLCAGWLELAVMAGLVLASRDKPLRERIKAIFLGALLLLLYNPFRIALTLASVGTPFFAIVHDVLFRISLVILLVVFYAFWYYWKAPSNLQGKRAFL